VSLFPYWSEADLAEIALVSRALVDCAVEHREHCTACRSSHRPCPTLSHAYDEACAWVERRGLTSKAEGLRIEHIVALRRVAA
jgi:hypothetical protein